MKPPGPRGRLITGSLGAFRKDMLGFMTELAREFGDVAGFRIGPFPFVLVSGPDLVNELLTKHHARLTKSWDYQALRIALGDGLVTSEGELWRRQRRLIQPAFHRDQLSGYGRIMVERTERLMSEWKDGEVRDIHDDMMRLTLEIVAESLFGVDVEAVVEPVQNALKETLDRFEALMTSDLPIPLFIPTAANRRLKKALDDFDAAVIEIIRQRRASSLEGHDLLSQLLRAKDEESGQMSDKQLRDELVTLLLAGHETTAIALSWTFVLLDRHPEVAQQLRAELQTVLPDRSPGADDIAALGLTERIIQESMRVYPPVWGIGRTVAEPLELGGYRLAKRTQVFIAQWVMHRDPRHFSDPERFDPDRWIEPVKHDKHAYIPFGSGPRKCVGAHFAMMEAVLVLATIASKYRVELIPDHPIELQPSVTLRPRHGVRARIRAHRQTEL